MSITPIGSNPTASAAQSTARSEMGQVSVTFAPGGQNTGPLDQIGAGVVSKLKQFENRRADSAKAMSHMSGGPANPVETAKAELLSGPASKSLSASTREATPANGGQTGDALVAMTRSFDYAIETQLIVKTGSQLSSSASSLMRGQ